MDGLPDMQIVITWWACGIIYNITGLTYFPFLHDDIIKWKHLPCYWPFVRGIHRSPMNSPHKGQWRVALMFSLICVWINGWVNNRKAGDLRHYRSHYDVTVMEGHIKENPVHAELFRGNIKIIHFLSFHKLEMCRYHGQQGQVSVSYVVNTMALDLQGWFSFMIWSSGSGVRSLNSWFVTVTEHQFNSLAPGRFEWNFRYVIFKQIFWSPCDECHWTSLMISQWLGGIRQQAITRANMTQISVTIWCH